MGNSFSHVQGNTDRRDRFLLLAIVDINSFFLRAHDVIVLAAFSVWRKDLSTDTFLPIRLLAFLLGVLPIRYCQ